MILEIYGINMQVDYLKQLCHSLSCEFDYVYVMSEITS